MATYSRLPLLLAVRDGSVLFGLDAGHSAAAKTNLGQMLRESTRGSSGRRGAHRMRNTLVVSEIALAVILLVGAGLLGRSFMNLRQSRSRFLSQAGEPSR